MTGKDKFLYIFLCVITFGIYYLVVNKKKNTNVSTELHTEEKVSVNVPMLIKAFGGEENIAGNEYTQTKVKIFIKDRAKVDVEEIKKIKSISGVVAGSKYVTIIVGKQAKALANLI